MRHKAIRGAILFAIAFSSTGAAVAQSRGGSCTGPFCGLTSFAIGSLLAGAFLWSIVASVKTKGVLRGFLGHSGVQLLFGYLAILAIGIGVVLGIVALLGKL